MPDRAARGSLTLPLIILKSHHLDVTFRGEQKLIS